MNTRTATTRFGGGPFDGSFPRDVVALVALLFVTFVLQFFASTARFVDLGRLTPDVVERGAVWRLVTYPFFGAGEPSGWTVVSLLFFAFFAASVRVALGARGFWRLLLAASVIAALVALAAHAALPPLAGPVLAPFGPMQGQWLLWTVVIAAYSLLFTERTVLLSFVLPVRAIWLLYVELVVIFVVFLGSRDLAAMIGSYAAVAAVALLLRLRWISLRELRLRTEKWWLERKMARLRRKSGLRVVRGDRHLN